jgi:hypothetical protein
MKSIVSIIFLLCVTGLAQAQSWDAKYENASFENRVNGYEAYTSEVKKVSGEFSKDEYSAIRNRCETKEGIFKLELSSDKTTIVIYYLSWIDQVTINWLFTEAVPELTLSLRIHPKVNFNF